MENPAGFWVRFFAGLLDAIIIGIPLSIISYLFFGVWEETSITSFGNILYSIIVPVLWVGFTVGKKIMGIRIIKVDGSKIGYGVMILRVIVGGIIYVVTLGIGLIVSAFMVGLRDDKRAIHDLIAGTYVTKNPPEI
jgi:uncharacterized RDD family membrane protein YckC